MRDDLALHALAGLIVAGFGSMLLPPGGVLALAVIVAWSKEKVWDKALRRGTYDSTDARYTTYAAIGGVTMIEAARWLLR